MTETSTLPTSQLIEDIRKATTPTEKLMVGLPSVLDFIGIEYEKDTTNPAHLQSMISGIRKKLDTERRSIPHNPGLADAMRELYLELSGVTNKVRKTPPKLVNYNPYAYLRDLADYLQNPEYTGLDVEIIQFVQTKLVKGWFRGYSRIWNVLEPEAINALKEYVGISKDTPIEEEALCEKILESINRGAKTWEYLSRILSACGGDDSIYHRCFEQIESDGRSRPHRSDRKFFSDTLNN